MPLSTGRRYAILALLALSILRTAWVIGDGPDRAAPAPEGARLESTDDFRTTAYTARQLAAQVELCFSRTGNFAACDSPAELGEIGISFGSGPREAEVRRADADTYEVAAYSSNGVEHVVPGSKHMLGQHNCYLPGTSCGGHVQ